MTKLLTLGQNPKIIALIGLLAGITAISGALIAQYGFDLYPCILCIYQRYAHGVAIAGGLSALVLPGRAQILMILISVTGLIGSAAVGAFQVGVEQKWWKGTEGCTGPDIANMKDLSALRDAIMNAPSVRCDEIAWEFLGISMAGYNILYSLGAALLMLVLLQRHWRCKIAY